MTKSILSEKSFAFAVAIVKKIGIVQNSKKEFELTKQLIRSGTSVGAQISEAAFGQSRADFIHKLSIALKEANESKYWLRLLNSTGYLDDDTFQILTNDCEVLIKLLVSSINTSKKNLNAAN